MSSILPLAQIPPLRELYARALLAAARRPRFPASPALLDRVSLLNGDITKIGCDAIVNAANKSLLGGGGVDGAIHRAAGPALLKECQTLSGCATGDAKISGGYALPALHVIHTVGPISSSSSADRAAERLQSCYRRSLEVAVANDVRSVAFPCISTGVYGYPPEEAAHVALAETRRFLDSDDGKTIERVVFVVFLPEDEDIYRRLIPLYFPPPVAAESEDAPEA
ncbi:A1pp-domain-containing protein [Amylostereum chailletii]|nr:A1pp-domain-containing protein [Amylostereum chailletii]